MGTSSSQRSPATPEWERVRELYRQPEPRPEQVAARIVQALDEQTRRGMHDRGVTICLDTLLISSGQISSAGLEAFLTQLSAPALQPATVQLASALRRSAEERIVRARAASRFAELAVDALAITAMDVASGGASRMFAAAPEEVESNFARFAREGRLDELSGVFLGYDLDRVFRYFVSRDLSDFVGHAPAFPDVGRANQFLDAIASHCRCVARSVPLERFRDDLAQCLVQPEQQRLGWMQEFLGQAMELCLSALAAGDTA